jgi:hypothetical protein
MPQFKFNLVLCRQEAEAGDGIARAVVTCTNLANVADQLSDEVWTQSSIASTAMHWLQV